MRYLRAAVLSGLLVMIVFAGFAIASAQTETPTIPPTLTPAFTPIPTATPISRESLQTAEYLVPEVINEFTHDATAYTQGLVLYNDNFYESTGKYGESTIRVVDPASGGVINQARLNESFFAEGLALVEDRLIQLTWREGYAFFWDIETLTPLGVYFYVGEGWGLCYDGESLWMSDGTATLYQRNPNSFKVIGQITVTLDGLPYSRLNELECVGDSIYANIYQQDYIFQIDKGNGVVTAVIDATNLLTPEEKAELSPRDEVLNGIAYDPESNSFFLTGKHWSKMFEVQFVAPE